MHLTNQWQSSIGNVSTPLEMEMSGCTVGNTLVLAYAVRGADNNPELSEGWVKLGGGNNASDAGDTDQKIYFATKKVASETESVVITQSVSKRMYAVCSEYYGVSSVMMRNDLAAIGTSNYTVTAGKSNASDSMVYAVTSTYYGSGRNQTVTPDDLTKIEGDSSAERLACWFDDGSGAMTHQFQSHNNTEERDVVLECVQLTLYDRKYLIRSGSTLYTVADEALSELETTELTAETFRTYGVDDIPAGSLLVGLNDPELLYWHDSTDDLPTLSLTVTGTPPTPQIVTTNEQDMSDSTILGIQSAEVDASEDVLFAISFDNGTNWKAYDGSQWVTVDTDNAGMTKATFEQIGLEAWKEVVTSTSYKLRFALMSTESYVKSVTIHYINQEESEGE